MQQQQRRLVDRVCPPKTNNIAPEIKSYEDMLEFERKLDFNMTRKTLDIQDSLKRPARVNKVLKVFITNLFYKQQDTGAPAWEVRIEGGLNDTRMPKRKFSSFFKSLVIELDSAIYGPDNHLVEWHRTANTLETDGFQVRRAGDLPVKCTILLQLNNTPPHFKIDPRLARLVGKQTDTRQAVIFALWQYIKCGALQDPQDREYINNDSYLQSIFDCKRMTFSEIPSKLNRLLTAPDPIVINHLIVRGNGESHRVTFNFDIEIENTIDTEILSHHTNEIRQLDEEVFGLVAEIKRSLSNYEFFSNFSQDPLQAINKWLASQSSDLKIMTDQIGDAEEERKADFYHQPWMREAVGRYFYRKVQERRNELDIALTRR